MSKELIVSVTPQETKAAILENDQVIEIHIERDKEHGVVGAICKGRVMKVLPGMQSAFVDIGLERDAFLYVSDFFEDADEYDKLVSTAEEQVEKLGQPASAAVSFVAAGLAPVPDGTVAPLAGNKFQDRRGRSRRSRRFRLKGKHYEGTPSTTASPLAPSTPVPSEVLPAASSSDGNDAQPALSLLPGESLAKYQEPSPEAPFESEARALLAGSEDTGDPREIEAAESGDLPLPALSMTELDSAEEEEVREVLAAAEVLSGSFLEAESEGVTKSETFPTAEEPAETLEAAPLSESLSEPAASAPAETAAVEASPLAAPTIADTPFAQASSSEPSVVSAQAEWSHTTPEPADFTGADSGSPTPTLGENATGAGVMTVAPGASTGPAGTAPGAAAGAAKAQFRNAPGTSKFFRRGTDRSRRPGGYEAREEGSTAPSAPLIADLLKEGQEILVQIAKEPLGTKGARITSHIALPGRYLVYMPTVDHIGVSRKIESDEERQRLKRIIQENRRSNFPGGFIVRTAGQGKGEEEFKADIKFLYALWAEIKMRADKKKGATIVHRDLNLVQRILRDQLSAEFSCIRVDNELEYTAIVEFINRFQPSLVSRVKLYTKETPIFEEFGVQSEIDKALRNKVWLKSGGYIVIDQAEALVAIDVNTGKYVGKSNKLEDTIVKTNIEAAKEIARQVRLRDLGGIIVCDFIDMEDRKNRLKVTQTLEEALRTDKSPSKILQFNDFGLVAITRKR
ncbi:MAG TPA: Rne/Rng family ribonuclease, partial [Terriglobia bacterium]|nr:Rne/Rng family ribonuclease [Terriglobia bacterium]